MIERIPIMIYGRMPMIGESIDEVRGMVLRSEILRRAAVDDYSSDMQEISREIVDESDQEGIDDGVHHEDMRELAKQRYEDSE